MPNIRFIAETAFSHEGDSNYLESLVDEILKSKVEVVKFQVLLKPEYMPDHPMAERCQSLTLDKQMWLRLVRRVKSSGKKVLILPVDFRALEWVVSENLADIIEIHSVNLFRRDFFNYLKSVKFKKELVLSVSGYELENLDYIVKKYKNLCFTSLTLMFGFQSFPTKSQNLAIGRISLLDNRYNLDVGYADHTGWDSDSSNLLAASVALGANTIEKHVVLEAGSERTDFNSAVDIFTLDKLIQDVRMVVSAIGDSKEYSLHDVERDYGNRRLRLMSIDTLAAGEKLMPPKVNYFWSTDKASKNPTELFEFFEKTAVTSMSKDNVIA